jgi:hypothetical protein
MNPEDKLKEALQFAREKEREGMRPYLFKEKGYVHLDLFPYVEFAVYRRHDVGRPGMTLRQAGIRKDVFQKLLEAGKTKEEIMAMEAPVWVTRGWMWSRTGCELIDKKKLVFWDEGMYKLAKKLESYHQLPAGVEILYFPTEEEARKALGEEFERARKIEYEY